MRDCISANMGSSDLPWQQFASDNYSGICPEALEYMIRANKSHEYAYGEDRWTQWACDLFRELFETDCEVFFVFNGTAGNGLALATLCQPYHSIVCHELAHVETDECGAPQFFSHGAKLWLASGENGKVDPHSAEYLVTRRTDIHYPKAKVISLTEATEVGTVYTPNELMAIRSMADKHSLRLHMDGARFANAVASLKVKPRELTIDCGIDVLCLGGSKNGLAVGEAVVFFDKGLAKEFAYRCKQAGQLASKMRFMAAPWVGVLKTGAWLRYAEHANRCAGILEERIKTIPGVEIMYPREANSVFITIPDAVVESLHQKGWHFYTFVGVGGARLVSSWDTTDVAIEAFIGDLKDCISHAA